MAETLEKTGWAEAVVESVEADSTTSNFDLSEVQIDPTEDLILEESDLEVYLVIKGGKGGSVEGDSFEAFLFLDPIDGQQISPTRFTNKEELDAALSENGLPPLVGIADIRKEVGETLTDKD